MVTLRMVCIAVALLLGAPVGWVLADHAIGHVSVPGGEVVNFALEEAATVTDIVLLSPPGRYDRLPIHDYPEQLVEGHIVFITIDIPIVENVTNFTFDIVGNVSCSTHVSGEGEFFEGIPIPRRINEAHEECEAAGETFVTPDPFLDSDRTTQSSFSPLAANGRRIPFETPDGQKSEAIEYEYYMLSRDWLGNEETTLLYAWSVPVLEGWLHSDGIERNAYCPIPEDRILEMGIESFQFRHESEMDPALLPQ